MKAVWMLVCVVAAFVIKSQVSLFGVAPNMTVVVAYYLGVKNGAGKGMAYGSLIGIIEDGLGGNMIGPNLLGQGVVGFFASFSSGSLLRWTPLLGMISLFVLTVMNGVLVFISRSIFGSMPGPLSTSMLTLLAQGLLNMGIGIFIKPRNVD